MANEFARNIVDAGFLYTFALPTQVGEANGKTSTAIDLGSASAFREAGFEAELSVPALSNTIAPSGSTAGAYYEIHMSASSTFNGEVGFYRENYVGTGSGVAAQTVRFRVPSNAPRYLRGKVWLGTTATDASAVTGTLTLKF